MTGQAIQALQNLQGGVESGFEAAREILRALGDPGSQRLATAHEGLENPRHRDAAAIAARCSGLLRKSRDAILRRTGALLGLGPEASRALFENPGIRSKRDAIQALGQLQGRR